jgi:hypothetical protein
VTYTQGFDRMGNPVYRRRPTLLERLQRLMFWCVITMVSLFTIMIMLGIASWLLVQMGAI